MKGGWARVSIDRRDLGPTPIFRAVLPAGEHVVVATLPDGAQQSHTVTIAADKASMLVLEWPTH
jgi:hypothetical protein